MSSGKKAVILIDGRTIREISAATGIREATLRARASKLAGCSVEDITDAWEQKKVRIGGKTFAEISRETGIPEHTLRWRYAHGVTDLSALTAPQYSYYRRQK